MSFKRHRAIIDLHNFVALINFSFPTIPQCPCFVIHSLKLKLTQCFLLLSLFHMSVRFSRHSFLIICLRNFSSLFLIATNSFLVVPCFLKTSILLTCYIRSLFSRTASVSSCSYLITEVF